MNLILNTENLENFVLWQDKHQCVNVGIFPIVHIFSYCDIGYADSTDTIIHLCFDLLFAEAYCLSLHYSLCPVCKEQTKALSQNTDILPIETFQDIASSSLLQAH